MKKGDHGFTIIEMLLALTLFAIVITSSFGVFSMGMQIWKRTQGRSAAEQKVLVALSRMGREIRGMLKTSNADIKGNGNDRSMIFPSIIRVPDGEGNEMLQYGRIGYRFEPAAGELCRFVESASDRHQKRTPACEPVARYLSHVRFQYWLESRIGGSHSWYDSWQESEDMPQAIRVVMEMKPLFAGEKYPVKRSFEETWMVPIGEKAKAREENL